MADIVVCTSVDAKTVAAEELDILLLSTEGKVEMQRYNDIDVLTEAWKGKKLASMAERLFGQDSTLADTLIQRVRTAGIENPQNVGGKASEISIAFENAAVTTALEASTTYYAKIGGKAVVAVTTGSAAPDSDDDYAALFENTSFTVDEITFKAAVSGDTAVFTSTTRTAVSGYTEDVQLYKDEDCFESVGLSGVVVVVTVGAADTTRAENLVAAVEALREENDDWYFLLTDVVDDDCVDALCEWANDSEPTEAALGAGTEDHRKFYVGQTTNKNYINTHGRSAVVMTDHPTTEWADCAWVGNVGPFWPEAVTWMWKIPDGLEPPDLTAAERKVLAENHVNFFNLEYKHEYMKPGICGDGNFIDNVLGADYITYQMRENLYKLFLEHPYIAYLDSGFAQVASCVYAALDKAASEDIHIIASDVESKMGVYTVTVPKRSEATDEQVRNRIMPDIKWEAQLNGSIHGAKAKGVLRVTL